MKTPVEYQQNAVVVPFAKPGNVLASDPTPFKIKLPPQPTPDEIYYKRRCASLNVADAATLANVTATTWRRWESGQSKVCRARWAWFLCATGGAMLPGGLKWDGWLINRHGLNDDQGKTHYAVCEIRSIPLLYARIRHLAQETRELRQKLVLISNDETASSRQRLAGELMAAGDLILSIISRAQNSSLGSADQIIEQIIANSEKPKANSVYSAAGSLFKLANNIIESMNPVE